MGAPEAWSRLENWPRAVVFWQLLGMFDRASDRGTHLDTCFKGSKTPKTP
jgi:hypothetical protein